MKEPLRDDCVRAIEVTNEQRRSLWEQGFVKLEGLFPPATVARLTEITDREIRKAPTKQGAEFSRFSYDLGLKGDLLERIYGSRGLKLVFRRLLSQPVFFTQGLGFELAQGDRGFTWHTGNVSFACLDPRDLGYTLWVPLTEIDAHAQHGGLAVCPKPLLSGEYRFKLWCHAVGSPEFRQRMREEKRHEFNLHYALGIEGETLDRLRVEHSFHPGDALLFDKFCWHRSLPLGPGPIQRRLAFAMRFFDHKARYCRQNLVNTVEAMDALGKKPSTSYGFRFTDIEEGDPISVSAFASPII